MTRPDRLMADFDAALVQQILDIPERQRETGLTGLPPVGYFSGCFESP